ncbi:hypothetical protein IAQ61_006738 [Plenodomus lingam]|uniref:uncharacterized protein n=1 Tax=Leptosphaeria maculans TaxID=5022 RepID=UPI003329A39A|nr:hypothetical protein IAQ61_006738 [Plenodomus lingam]
MASKNTGKKRRARKRTVGNVRVAKQFPSRTLKPSARRQIHRERAPHLWICPGIEDPVNARDTSYPRASLLSLPLEIRQQILYLSLDVRDMEAAARAEQATGEEKKRWEASTVQKLRDERLVGVPFTLWEIKMLKLFCRATTVLYVLFVRRFPRVIR